MLKRRKFSVIIVSVSLLIGAAGLLFWEWHRSQEAEMSERPPVRASRLTLETHESVVFADLTIPYPVLGKALNELASQLGGTKKGSEKICVENDFPKVKECVKMKWSVTFEPDGIISIGRSGERVKVTVPVSFNGAAGFTGRIAKILKLEKKEFSGSFLATAETSAALNERFCPVLTPGKVNFDWKSPAKVKMIGKSDFEILKIKFSVGPWFLDVSPYLTDVIRDKLKDVVQKAAKKIKCKSVRSQVARVWRKYSIPLTIKGLSSLFLNIEPSTLGSSPLLVEDEGVRVIVKANVKAEVSTKRGSNESMGELPVHIAVGQEEGRMALAIPLHVEYGSLRSTIMRAVSGRTFHSDGAEQSASVTVQDVEIYPSEDNVVLGVRFSAALPWRLLDAKGVVWLKAKPVVLANGKVVGLREISITRKIDNELWNSLSTLFKGRINREIAEVAQYDLSEEMQKAWKAVQVATSDTDKTGGVQFTVADPKLRLGRVMVESDGLAVECLIDMKWRATLESSWI